MNYACLHEHILILLHLFREPLGTFVTEITYCEHPIILAGFTCSERVWRWVTASVAYHLDLTDNARLAGLQSLGILLSLPPGDRITGMCQHAMLFVCLNFTEGTSTSPHCLRLLLMLRQDTRGKATQAKAHSCRWRPSRAHYYLWRIFVALLRVQFSSLQD